MTNLDTDPVVFFLPFALPDTIGLPAIDDPVLARRIPDFMHHLLNRGGGAGPAGMLEVQSPPGDDAIRWVTLSEPPDPDDVFATLGADGLVSAIVSGAIHAAGSALTLELHVHFAPAAERRERIEMAHTVSLDDPAADLGSVARHLAKLLGLRAPSGFDGLSTADASAFFKFLEALDGAALIGGDPALERERRGEVLLEPFADALGKDPRFALVLRTLAHSLPAAMTGGRVSEGACCRVIDRCLETGPTDSDGCVAIAEQLTLLGDHDRATSWLRHAARQEPPAPRALENLGVLYANRGELVQARDLWLRGLSLDGHPDFFAHLSRLAFSESNTHEAWDKVLRGLRRIYERAVRPGEWDDDARTPGIMLRYLAEHLTEHRAPDEVAEALHDLAGALGDPDSRVDLGSCLLALDNVELARVEIEAGLNDDVQHSTRDRGVRALLGIELEDFERRFAEATDRAVHGRDPRPALIEMQSFLERQPEFWPALFFAGIALRRLGREEDALDLMSEVLDRRPGQPDALREMAVLFDRRGNPKRALECVDEALHVRPDEAELHAHRGRFLRRLGRYVEAERSLERAIELDPENPRYRRQRALILTDR